MKKFLRLTCTVCKRSIDKLVDLTHYSPDQCTITLGCEGRLQPVEYRSSGGIAVAPEVGVTDWRPRGSTSNAPFLGVVDPDLIGLETGSLKQLVIALLSNEPASGAIYPVQFTVKADTPKTYRQYVFRKEGAFSTISGIESGLEKKALRFTAYGLDPDEVEVYLNGVKLEPGTDPENYQIYDGTNTSAVPPNTVLFNTTLDSAASTQVDIIVSKAAPASIITLSFTRNQADESRITVGSWENVSYVDKLEGTTWRRYYLFTLDLDTADIPVNSILIPSADAAFFLLARRPYTRLDRYTDVAVSFQGLDVERDYLKFYVENGVTTMRVTSTAISTFFPPMRPGKFTVEKIIKVATAGVEEQLVVDGKVITGPDV